jgi:hypothetical protein
MYAADRAAGTGIPALSPPETGLLGCLSTPSKVFLRESPAGRPGFVGEFLLPPALARR